MQRKSEPTTALYVRLPTGAARRLDQAAEALGTPKKDLVAGLVSRYLDPDSETGLTALRGLATTRHITIQESDEDRYIPAGQVYGVAGRPSGWLPLPEVLTSVQAAQLLAVPERVVVELAESGELPGRKLGEQWRFSKAALVAWLAGPDAVKRPAR
jgi:excisionase family DNA binding protein